MDNILINPRKIFSVINFLCAVIAAGLLLMIAAIICLEVSLRGLGFASQLWVIEVSEYALLFITFLGAPYLLEKNMHVVMDLFYDSAPPKLKVFLKLMNASTGLLLCLIFTIVGAGVVIEQFQLGVRQVTVMRPESWWITAALPISMGLMSIQFFDQIIQAIQGQGEQ